MKILAENYPELLSEWDYKKNTINPLKIGSSSDEKVWWICPNGHSYQAKIGVRTRKNKTGCPICAGQKVLSGYNDLKTKYPKIAKEWDYKKNYPLRPENVMPGSTKKVWWICPNGHSYYSVISNRRKGVGCAICKNKKVLKGYNDLATTRPDLLKLWNFEKNNELGIYPTEVTSVSGKKVWWKCENGDEWENTIAHISYGERCPFCNMRKNAGASTSFPEQAIYYYLKKLNNNCLNRYKYEKKYEIDIYIPCLKFGIEYDGYRWHSEEVKQEREKNKNEALKKAGITLVRVKEINKREKILDRYYFENDIYYLNNDDIFNLNKVINNIANKYLNTNIKVDIENDRQDIYNNYLNETKKESVLINEELMKWWDYNKNLDIKPENFTKSSGKIVWWKCKYGHSFKKSIHLMDARIVCPICFKNRGYENRFELKYPELLNEWDYDMNLDVSPDEIQLASVKKIWWICEKGHSWQAPIRSRITGSGCPYCSNKKILEGYNDFATLFPNLLKEWDYSKNNKLQIYPNKILAGTSKRVWWKCSKCGYEWNAILNSRTKQGTGCKICSRINSDKKHYSNSKTRLLKNNKIMSEYDYSKNVEINLGTLRVGSKKMIHWKCSKCGNEFIATPYDMTKGIKKCIKCKEKNKTQHNFIY